MRPFLISTSSFAVGSYPLMLLIAAFAAIGSLMWRTQNRNDIDASLFFWMLPAALVSGWILSGVVMALPNGLSFESLRTNLSPLTRSGHTITFFGAGAAIVIAITLLPRGRAAFQYFDALAPSFPLGLAFAKTGCFLAGCCAGTLCDYPIAVTYPFGSRAYDAQWREGLVTPPEELLVSDSSGKQRLLGHAQALRVSLPQSLSGHAQQNGMTVDELIASASKPRSLPVWPVQLAYVLCALLLWIAVEACYRRRMFPGAAIGLVLTGYGIMRIALDYFVEGLDPVLLGLTVPQWSGVIATAVGLGLAFAGWRMQRHTTRRPVA